jgi:hypothetical protein
MERIKVESTNIAEIGWEDRVLEIQFKGRGGSKGSVYSYAAVPESVWDAFRNAPSKGGFFASRIKGSYPAQKIQ